MTEQGIVDMRRLQTEGTPVERATLQLGWKLYIDGATPEIEAAHDQANTQDLETAQDESKRGSVQPPQQPLVGSATSNADQAND